MCTKQIYRSPEVGSKRLEPTVLLGSSRISTAENADSRKSVSSVPLWFKPLILVSCRKKAASFAPTACKVGGSSLITLRRVLPWNRNQVLLIQILHRPMIGLRVRHRNIPRRTHLLQFRRGRSLTRCRGVDRLVEKRS